MDIIFVFNCSPLSPSGTYLFVYARGAPQKVPQLEKPSSLLILLLSDSLQLHGQVLDVAAEVLDCLETVLEITEDKTNKLYDLSFSFYLNTIISIKVD